MVEVRIFQCRIGFLVSVQKIGVSLHCGLILYFRCFVSEGNAVFVFVTVLFSFVAQKSTLFSITMLF